MMKYWLFQLLKIPDNMELIKLSAQKAKMEIYRGMLGKFFPKYYVNIILFIYFRDKSPAE